MTVYLIERSLRTSIFPSRTRVSKRCSGSLAGPRNIIKSLAVSSERFYSRTTITGQWACLTTEPETLPIKALLIPP